MTRKIATKGQILQDVIRQRVAESGSVNTSLVVSNRPVLSHLPGLHEDLFVVPPSGTEIVFGFNDLSAAMQASGSSISVFNTGETGSYLESVALRRSVQMIEGMASDIAGAAVDVSATYRGGDSSEEDELVVTVTWPSTDEAQLIAWNDALMAAVASDIPAEDRAVLVIVPGVAHADQPR